MWFPPLTPPEDWKPWLLFLFLPSPRVFCIPYSIGAIIPFHSFKTGLMYNASFVLALSFLRMFEGLFQRFPVLSFPKPSQNFPKDSQSRPRWLDLFFALFSLFVDWFKLHPMPTFFSPSNHSCVPLRWTVFFFFFFSMTPNVPSAPAFFVLVFFFLLFFFFWCGDYPFPPRSLENTFEIIEHSLLRSKCEIVFPF